MTTEKKAQQIVDHITYDILLSNKLIMLITKELTDNEIDMIWRDLKLNLNALNDD